MKCLYEKEKATMFTLRINKPVQEYALDFLNIFNNAREYPDTFYNVMNNSGDCVYVTCNTKRKDSVKEYLEEFGEILYEDIVNRIVITPELDSKTWNDIYADENVDEVQFEVEVD
jgi:hypothetical protein